MFEIIWHWIINSTDRKIKYIYSNKSVIIYQLLKPKCIKSIIYCKTSLSNISKISSISDLGDYKYICCSNCGCIMKLDYNCNLTNSKNILKEVSDAYVLFKKVDMEPESYSYTRNGERHNF